MERVQDLGAAAMGAGSSPGLQRHPRSESKDRPSPEEDKHHRAGGVAELRLERRSMRPGGGPDVSQVTLDRSRVASDEIPHGWRWAETAVAGSSVVMDTGKGHTASGFTYYVRQRARVGHPPAQRR